MSELRKSSEQYLQRDVAAGALIAIIGIILLGAALQYSFGDLSSPGPALFPALASGLMVVLGGWVATQAWLGVRGQAIPFEMPRPSLRGLLYQARPIIFISLSILVFCAFIERLGLIIAIFCSVCVAKYAESPVRPVEAIALGAGLSVVGVVVFVYLLNLPFHLWWK